MGSGSPPDPISKAPLFSHFLVSEQQPCLGSLLSWDVSREPKQSTPEALPCCFFYPHFFFCFAVPGINKHILKPIWARVVKSFLQYRPA